MDMSLGVLLEPPFLLLGLRRAHTVVVMDVVLALQLAIGLQLDRLPVVELSDQSEPSSAGGQRAWWICLSARRQRES